MANRNLAAGETPVVPPLLEAPAVSRGVAVPERETEPETVPEPPVRLRLDDFFQMTLHGTSIEFLQVFRGRERDAGRLFDTLDGYQTRYEAFLRQPLG